MSWATINQIRAHPWYQKYNSFQVEKGIVVGQDAIPVDLTVLGKLIDLGFEKEYAVWCI